MKPHWESIHYVRRPSKNIERKMIIEILARLGSLRDLAEFQYVGFGSLYFVDFALLHSRFGMTEMTSIEGEPDADARVRVLWNRPFDCVNVRFGHSNDVLPDLDWTRPAIVWLDYTGPIDGSVFADLDTVTTKLSPPSVLFVTVNVEAEEPVGRFDAYAKRVGPDRIPPGVNADADLADDKMAAAARETFDAEIGSLIHARNQVPGNNQQVAYRQLFNFRYRDSHRMLTVGGLVYRSAEAPAVDNCKFDRSPHVRADADPFEIVAPHLTLREMLELSRQMPTVPAADIDRHGIPVADVEEFVKGYRYFPTFIDVDVL